MAVSRGKTKKKSGFGWLLFWLAFLIGLTLLFVINREKIQNSLSILKDLISEPGDAPSADEEGSGEITTADQEPRQPAVEPVPAVQPPLSGADAQPSITQPSAAQPPAAQPPAANSPATQTPPATVKRQVYLIRLDNDGGLVAAKVERSLPSGDSPMRDALEAVIRGPSADESKRNLLSLIPENVTILGATVRGATAYVDFSEDFLFNTYGIEGYAGQLRQVVWTATEFGNVKDVQILIEGKRIDYLGEGIWIGSPLSREMIP